MRAFVADWIAKRRQRGLDWKNDESRLKHHVLPEHDEEGWDRAARPPQCEVFIIESGGVLPLCARFARGGVQVPPTGTGGQAGAA